MMIATTAFIRGEAAAASKKKGHGSWKPQDQPKKHADKRPDFRGHSRDGRGANRFTPLTRTPKEILAAEANKYQPPPPMVTPVEKRNSNKFCDFHNDKGHSTDECMQLKKQIEDNGTEGPLVIEAEIGGHTIHRMYIDGGSSMEILYEHCFNRLRPDIKSQMVPATTSLTGFSGETTWPLGQLRLLVTIGDVTHSTKAWMNFMIVKSLSPYNGIIGRPGLKAIQAVSSTVYGMLKFLTEEGIVTIRSSLLIPAECALVDTSSVTPREKKTRPANLTVTLHPNFPDQEVVDCNPLPEIDWKVESLCGYPFKSFLDAYKGYHQIQLAAADEENSAFHTGQGVYCYTKMPFGLKNAGATYQRLMDKAFESKMGRNIERKEYSLGQILANFLNEIPSNASQGVSVAETQEEPWTLFTDGSSCVDGSGAWLILTNPDGVEFTYALRFQFAASKNEAEYEALIAGLRIATQMGVKNIQANVNSKLVANQVLGTYVAKEDNMIKYLEIAKGLVSGFKTFSISQVPRSRNKKAYALSKIAPTSFAHLSKQIHRPVTRHPQQPLTPITAPWPFYKWGIDIAGPFSKGPGKVKFLIVAMDYFTKWIEAKAVATITGEQSNGLVERANRSLEEGIKARLGEGNKNWVEELPHVLWAHRTMIKTSHGDTPFSLTYGTEAVIPAEIGMPTYRTTAVDVVNNDEELQERRELVAMSEAKSKSKMMKYYNSRVRGMAFKPGDFVYRSNEASHTVAGGKLGPKWEGPYEVTDALGNRAYKLRSTDGTVLPRT
nr:reverse transcriptase domain-containing protein [Tanacetum cinerariifolium]